MKRKVCGIVVALLLMIQTLYGTSAWPVQAAVSVQDSVYGVTNDVYDPQPAPVTNTDNILTKVVLTDSNGTVIDSVYNPDSKLEIGEAVNLSYEWELPNGHSYKNGDTFIFELPEQFEIFTDIDAPLVADQDEVGRFTVDRDGKVVMTFNDYVERHSNVSGKLEIRTEFTKETIQGSTEVIIAIPVQSGLQTVIVNLKPKGGKLIEKQGTAIGKSQIDWRVQVNKSLDKIKHAVITDVMPDGLELTQDSVKLYHLQVNGDGSTVLGTAVDSSKYTVLISEGKKLELAFQDETISKAYELRFSTKLTGEQERFENTAVLSGEGMEDSRATATVTVQRGQFLEKSYNQDSETGIITWRVKYNFNEKKLTRDQAVLTDEFSAIHTMVPDSLKVYAGDSTNAKDLVATEDYTVTMTGPNSFKLQFEKAIDSPYTIIYKTKPIDRLSAEGKQVKNKVVSGDTSKEVTAPAQGTRALVKGVWGVNFANKTSKWMITINGDKKPDGSKYSMENVVIQDTFPHDGLEFLPNSVIVRSNGNLVPASDYKVEYDHVRKGFVIRFSKTIDTTYTIEYDSKFDIDWLRDRKLDFMNRATMTWVENGEVKGPIQRDASFASDDYTKNNGGKDGSYNPVNKEITWNVKLNYNLDPLDQASVTDVLKQGQQLVPNSVKVYEMKLTGSWNGVTKGTEIPASQYKVTEPSEANGNQLSVQFNNPISSAYWIEFKTSLQGTLVVRQIENTAELWNGSKQEATWKASVYVPHGGDYVRKQGAQNGNKIDWSIRINEGQSHISNVRIIDFPSSNQILIEDSFRLYATKIQASGEAVKAEELTKGKDYTLTISRLEDGQETFELKFTNAISTAYILEYQSFITAEDKEAVSNKVGLEGDQLKTEVRDTTKEIIVRTSSGSGSGGGVTGSLEVTKVDLADPSKTLAGAKFALYDQAGKRVPIVKSTDADGKILFTKLLYDDYVLEELVAPAGYKIEQAKWNVTIDSSIKSQGNVKSITVTNRKEEPVGPGPTDPTDPVDPTDPGNPGPGGPENPGPGGPTDPTDPVDPTDPGPGGPTNPTDPGPDNPGNPSNPGTPSKPDRDRPSDHNPDPGPGNPSNPGTPPTGIEVPDEDIPRGEPGDPGDPQPPTVEIDEDDIPRGVGEPEPGQPDPEPETPAAPTPDPRIPASKQQVQLLPQTGESSHAPFYIGGLVLILLGVWLARKRIKMK